MIGLIIKYQGCLSWGGKRRARRQSSVPVSSGTTDVFPPLPSPSFPCFVGCVSQPLSSLLNGKPFGPHPSAGVDNPEALISFLHK